MGDVPPPPPPGSTPPEIAAGWYPAPSGEPYQRYWDGAAWTEHTAPMHETHASAFGRKGSAEHFLLPTGRSGWAIAAGYLGLFSILVVFAPFAIIAGVLGLRQISRQADLGGRGRAWFGIVMGSLVSLAVLATALLG